MVVNHLRKFTRSVLPTVVQGLVLASASYACFSPPGRPSGQATDANSDAPVEPPASPTGVHRIAAGANNACAIDNEGALWCWGNSEYQMLGPASADKVEQPGPYKLPIDVTPENNAKWESVAVGDEHVCGKKGPGIYCWGNNFQQQQGGASTAGSIQPSKVPLPEGFAAETIDVGPRFSCAHGTNQQQPVSYCWGQVSWNGRDNTETRASATLVPMQIGPMISQPKWVKIVGSDGHRCALSATHKVYCWGDGAKLRLGNGESNSMLSAASDAYEVAGDYTDIAVNAVTSCGITTAGAAVCWGDQDALILEDRQASPTPIPLSPNQNWVSIALGEEFACVRNSVGEVQCWGKADSGANGGLDGARTARDVTPVAITGFGGAGYRATDLVAGQEFACARTATGEHAVVCWGTNHHGNQGTGIPGTSHRPQPVELTLPPGVVAKQIIAGGHHTCIMAAAPSATPNDAHTLMCWGRNNAKQIPNTDERVVYPAVSATSNATVAAAASDHTCWVAHGKDVQCSQQEAVINIANAEGATSWTKLATNAETCAIDNQNKLWCWGNDLAVRDTASHTGVQERAAPSGTSWRDIVAGNGVLFAVTLGGQIHGWGNPAENRLAGATARISAPIMGVNAGVTVASAANSGGHACVVKSQAPLLQCWGNNASKQINATDESSVAVKSIAIPNFTPTAIATASEFTCAIGTDNLGTGSVRCWGSRSAMGHVASNAGPSATAEAIDLGGVQATHIAAGDSHACAIVNDGNRVVCWGRGDLGELGNGGQSRSTPVAAKVPR